MKVALAIAIPLGVFLTLVAWRLSQLLSSDAIAMAIGMLLGVLSLAAPTALVLAASRRDDEDDWQPTDINYPAPRIVYSDDVTPYTRIARRVAGMPQLPDRQAEIDRLRTVLDYIEAQEAQ